MVIETALILFYTLLFIFIIRKLKFFNLPGIGKNTISSIFVLKIITGIGLWAIYTYYYTDRATADIFKYFDDSKIMYQAAFKKPIDFLKMITGIQNNSDYFNEMYYNQMNNWFRVHESTLYNESHSLIRFNALIRFLSFGHYNVHTVFMCFFSLTGLVALYRFLFKYIRKGKNIIFLSVFLLPTVLFWGSGVLKEGLIVTGLGLLLWSFDKIINKSKNIYVCLIFLFSLFLVRYTKFYIIVSLFPLMLSLLWLKYTNYKKIFLKFSFTTLLIVLAGCFFSYFILNLDVLAELARKQRDFIGLAHFVNSGSLLKVQILKPNLLSLLSNSPEAFYNVLFRPWFFEVRTPLFLFAAFENLLLIIIALLVVFFYKKPDKKQKVFICFSAIFVLEIFLLTGLTTPVVGAIVRYKLPALPFLFLSLLTLIDFNKLIQKLMFIKKINFINWFSFNKFNVYNCIWKK